MSDREHLNYFSISERMRQWGVYVTCVGHSVWVPGAEFPSRAHPNRYFFDWRVGRVLDEWQIACVEEGEGEIEFRDGIHKLAKGSVSLIAPGEWHRHRPDPIMGWTTNWIGFSGEAITSMMKKPFFNPHGGVRHYPATTSLISRFAETVKAISASGKSRPFVAAAHLQTLLAEIQEYETASEPESIRKKVIFAAQDYLCEHASEVVDFALLAENFGLSYRTFRADFARITNFSPLQYQLSQRMEKAKSLLVSSDLSVAEVARECGFKSVWHFNHYFRKSTDLAPADYRKTRRRQISRD